MMTSPAEPPGGKDGPRPVRISQNASPFNCIQFLSISHFGKYPQRWTRLIQTSGGSQRLQI